LLDTATLKVRKQGVTGTNPFNTIMGNLLADIKKGAFSNSDPCSSATSMRCQQYRVLTFTNTPSGTGWYSQSLVSGDFSYVKTNGTTQFRLYFAVDDNDDLSPDILQMHSGNAAKSIGPSS